MEQSTSTPLNLLKGVDLWNSFLIQLKSSKTIKGFKKRYKLNIMEKYRKLE